MDGDMRPRRDFHRLSVIARLKNGIALEQARTAFETIAATLARQYPEFNKDESIVVNPILDDMVGQIRPALLVGALALVLLIACANVANLLLAKGAARQREIAIRSSLGAGRWRMGMRFLRGRTFTERDIAGSPLRVVVNQILVDRYFPGQDPIGKRLEIAFRTPPNWREIVGVVADIRSAGLDQDTPVQVYAAYLQRPGVLPMFVPAITVLARTVQDPALLGGAINVAILNVDRSQPVYSTDD